MILTKVRTRLFNDCAYCLSYSHVTYLNVNKPDLRWAQWIVAKFLILCWTNEPVNEWARELVSPWKSEPVNEWARERMSPWKNEPGCERIDIVWMSVNDQAFEKESRERTNERTSFLMTQNTLLEIELYTRDQISVFLVAFHECTKLWYMKFEQIICRYTAVER